MPERANSITSAFLAGALAAAMTAGLNTAASAAADCLESPDLRVTGPGHWYYHQDRTQDRRCWHFEAAEVKPAEPAASTVAPPAPAEAAADTPQALLTRFANGLSQSLSPPPSPQPQPQAVSLPETSSEATQPAAPKPPKRSKAVRQERPQVVPAPTTSGAASSERQDQPQPVAAGKTEQRDPPLDVAEREALFQDFVKWQLEREVFGRQ